MATDVATPSGPSSEASAPMDAEEHLLLHAERSSIFETRVERAALCRDRGSARFREKDLAGAAAWYERSLFHVDFDEGTWHFEFLDKHRAAVNEVRLPVYLNLAACYLAEGATQDLAKVVDKASLALEIDADNAKALYRAGRAHLALGDLDAARDKLGRAAKLQPSDRHIREALQTLRTKLGEHKAREKETWGGRLLADAKADAKADVKMDAKMDAQGGASTVASGLAGGLRAWIVAAMVLVAGIVLGAMHLTG